MIYHLAGQEAWERAQREGEYRGDTLASEGFIHCSNADQILRVANRYYRGRSDLVLLTIDEERVKSKVVYEAAPDGERFPHIYGPLNLDAVTGSRKILPGPDGSFRE
jgi:uncharacterized protein (DUF952 family)